MEQELNIKTLISAQFLDLAIQTYNFPAGGYKELIIP